MSPAHHRHHVTDTELHLFFLTHLSKKAS